MITQAPTWSVSELTDYIKNTLEATLPLIQVSGEISNCIQARSGHWYFTIKDASSQMRCVWFASRFNGLKLKNGMAITLQSSLTFYTARGDCQLNVFHVTLAGEGDLWAALQALQARLALEGVVSRKRPLPSWPRHIGIITSERGAALQDMLTTLQNRYTLACVTLFSTEVQGIQALPSLLKACEQAQTSHCDVLIVARGGGSIEDLWAFNLEPLVRALVNMPMPVVTGIGHETDHTLADWIADLRAATPTASIVQVTPDQQAYYQRCQEWPIQHQGILERLLKQNQQRYQQLCQQLEQAWQRRRQYYFEKLTYLESLLQAYDPHRLYQQGWVYLVDAPNRPFQLHQMLWLQTAEARYCVEIKHILPL